MQRRGGLIAFVILNILISLAVAFGVISFFGAQNPPQSPVQFVTSQVIVTATPDPNATIAVRIITATPQPGSQPTLPPVVSLPTDLLGTSGAQSAVVTLDATTIGVISASDSLAATATSPSSEGCAIARANHSGAGGATPLKRSMGRMWSGLSVIRSSPHSCNRSDEQVFAAIISPLAGRSKVAQRLSSRGCSARH